MLKNFFLTSFRNIKRNLGYTFLNVTGLTLSIASCLVIFLIVKNELSYDTFHRKAARTYRVTMNALDYNPSVSMAIVPALRNDFPELENVSQYFYQFSGQVQVGDMRFNEKGFAYADEEFPQIFDYHWLAGNARTALAAPNAVVLTESIARKYFGDKDPMGKTMKLNNQFDLLVSGLIADPPANTNQPFTFLVSYETIKTGLKGPMSNFYAIMGGNAFVVLPEEYPSSRMQRRMPEFIRKNWGGDIAKEAKLLLQPLREIHFDQRYLNNTVSPTTSRETYYALGIVAVFIILTACINFINMATAQSIKRAKEVGVRKVLGAKRGHLIGQFLGETSMLVITALALGLACAMVFLPQAGQWLNIHINASALMQPGVLILMAVLTIIMILLAGLYPAFVQSSYLPAVSLKSTKDIFIRGLTLRKVLVLIQFIISQVLIVGTLIVAHQMDFFRNQDLGYNKDAVLSFGIPDKTKRDKLEQLLKNNPGVRDISFSSGAPAYMSNATNFKSPELGVMKDDVTEVKFIDEHYIDMFALKMLAGQKVGIRHENDTALNVVVNETMISKLGLPDPVQAIGKHFTVGDNFATITGVVKDFQSESKHKLRRPCVLAYNKAAFYRSSLRIAPASMSTTIARIDKEWSALFPDSVFEYEFLDDHIASMYRQEEKMFTAFKLFSGLAILIGCLGLYGLVNISTVQRIKEVGIRKILGASMVNIVGLFAKEFVSLILIAFLFAAPIAYFVMHSWLENFAYQANITVEVFVVSIAASLLISGLTIAYRSIKAAIVNPARSLRTE